MKSGCSRSVPCWSRRRSSRSPRRIPSRRCRRCSRRQQSKPIPRCQAGCRRLAQPTAPAARRHRPMPPLPVEMSPFPRTGAACSTRSMPAIGRRPRPGSRRFPPSVLTPVAKAELYTAKGSPVGRPRLASGADRRGARAPQADQLAHMAIKRGATTAPLIVPREADRTCSAPRPSATRRIRSRASLPPTSCARSLDPLVKADDAAGAEAQLLTLCAPLSVEARAEAGTARRLRLLRPRARPRRAARRRYLAAGCDRRMGEPGRVGLRPRLVAARRLQRRLGRLPAGRASSPSSASFAPAAIIGRRGPSRPRAGPRSVEPLLARRHAAKSAESFYGLLARETLGMPTRLAGRPVHRQRSADRPISQRPARDRACADRRARARRGDAPPPGEDRAPTEHHALIQLAKRLDLPAAQLWLANNGQRGARSDAADRYPNPRWPPLDGWRVDPALAFGHIVQESAFRRTAISPAGAVGLMQVLPDHRAAQCRDSRGVPYSPRYA